MGLGPIPWSDTSRTRSRGYNPRRRLYLGSGQIPPFTRWRWLDYYTFVTLGLSPGIRLHSRPPGVDQWLPFYVFGPR
jgi:hypothetical protein